MIIKLAASIAMVCLTANAMADAYVVSSKNGSDDIKVVAKHGDQKCVYADKEVQPGDTVALKDTGVVMVCAKGEHGGIFYSVAPERANRAASAIQ